jgi:hypothetical protein
VDDKAENSKDSIGTALNPNKVARSKTGKTSNACTTVNAQDPELKLI